MTKKSIPILFFALIAICCRARAQSDTALVRSYLTTLTKTNRFRTYSQTDQLNQVAAYIKTVFDKYADSVSVQEYTVNGQVYKNVICSFGTKNKRRVVVGAHYDACGNQQGADDNASGITGLLELVRLLKGQKLNNRVDLVAYTLEEPPFFRTENMGSYIHAKWLADSRADVYGMISLEMIGYFKDEAKSQMYPIGLLSMFYGNRGNYITLVKKWGAGKFARRFCSRFRLAKTIRTKTFSGPAALPGIDFSDHLNYWKFGFSALMITDTSFYRNPNYHQSTDTMETLDIPRMAQVIDATFKTLVAL